MSESIQITDGGFLSLSNNNNQMTIRIDGKDGRISGRGKLDIINNKNEGMLFDPDKNTLTFHKGQLLLFRLNADKGTLIIISPKMKAFEVNEEDIKLIRKNLIVENGDITVLDQNKKKIFRFSINKNNPFLVLGGKDNNFSLVIRDNLDKNLFGFASSTKTFFLGTPSKEVTMKICGNIEVKNNHGNIFLETYSNFKNYGELKLGNKKIKGGLILTDEHGNIRIGLDGDGTIFIKNHLHNDVFRLDSQGNLSMYNISNDKTIELNAHQGDIRLKGADFAENFETDQDLIMPGTVMSISDDGKLTPCKKEYDKRVAGIVSGAGGNTPGIILNNNEKESGKCLVALTGRVYCLAEAFEKPIEIGDLLTTSVHQGYAKKATDPSRSFGAILGKAMQKLDSGTGLILVLVTLQ